MNLCAFLDVRNVRHGDDDRVRCSDLGRWWDTGGKGESGRLRRKCVCSSRAAIASAMRVQHGRHATAVAATQYPVFFRCGLLRRSAEQQNQFACLSADAPRPPRPRSRRGMRPRAMRVGRSRHQPHLEPCACQSEGGLRHPHQYECVSRPPSSSLNQISAFDAAPRPLDVRH